MGKVCLYGFERASYVGGASLSGELKSYVSQEVIFDSSSQWNSGFLGRAP